jgi:hypothetical protein
MNLTINFYDNLKDFIQD